MPLVEKKEKNGEFLFCAHISVIMVKYRSFSCILSSGRDDILSMSWDKTIVCTKVFRTLLKLRALIKSNSDR